jgi:CBS domain-containing protein
VARLFEENEISGAPVVDAQGRVVGVVSRTDLIRRYTEGDSDYDPKYLLELFGSDEADEDEPGPMPEPLITVDDFMTSDPITAPPTANVQTLAAKMVNSRVHRVVIIDDQRFPVGIVTSLDLVKALAGI